jgi:hypothetical protein
MERRDRSAPSLTQKDARMTTTTLNLRVEPYRLLTKTEAAHYCRRSPKKFEEQCPVRPIEMADGDRLWDVQDLDRWIDDLKAGVAGETMDKIVQKLR